MAVRVAMPKLGMAMAEGTVAEWVRGDGAAVEQGDVVAIVESDKITYEVRAPASGTLRHAAQAQQTLPVGATLSYVLAAGEAMPREEAVADRPVASPAAPPAGVARAPAPATAEPGAALATPLAKRLAREHGARLEEITGSGPGGRIQEQDVLAYLARRGQGAAAPRWKSVPLKGMRQTIATRLGESLRTMAQVTITTEADVTAFVAVYERLKQAEGISATSALVKAVAAALRRHPRLNATLVGDEIRLHAAIHVGVAVALEEGLIVPVVRNADQESVRQLDQEIKRLSAAARANALTVDEVAGATFSITNLGMYGIDAFTPVINPPEVAILGIGRIVEKPAVYQGEIAKRQMMTLSLTFDHRAVDGAPAAEFLQTLRELLEQPEPALLSGAA